MKAPVGNLIDFFIFCSVVGSLYYHAKVRITIVSYLISSLAGHCAAINGVPVNPEIMKAVLGKYHLVLQDVAVQEKDVSYILSRHYT